MTDELSQDSPADRAPEGDSTFRKDGSRPWMPPSENRVLAERLAAARTEAPRPRGADEPEPPARPDEPRPLPAARRRPQGQGGHGLLVLGIIATMLFAAAFGYVGWLALTNKDRAALWEERSFALERNIKQLNGLLIERSTQLNERTRELNNLAGKVQKTQSALSRSESDVASLSERQRELAAEKAQVEDSRAGLEVQSSALRTVADAFVECKDGLVELLGYMIEGDNSSASQVIDAVGADCSYAESQLATYRARYGG